MLHLRQLPPSRRFSKCCTGSVSQGTFCSTVLLFDLASLPIATTVPNHGPDLWFNLPLLRFEIPQFAVLRAVELLYSTTKACVPN